MTNFKAMNFNLTQEQALRNWSTGLAKLSSGEWPSAAEREAVSYFGGESLLRRSVFVRAVAGQLETGAVDLQYGGLPLQGRVRRS